MTKVLVVALVLSVSLFTMSFAESILFYTSEQPASVLDGALKCGQCQNIPESRYFMCEISRVRVKERKDVYIFHCPQGTAYIHKSQMIKIVPKAFR